MRTNKSAERQGGWDCPKDNRSGGRAPVETGLRHSGSLQRTPQGDMPRRAAAVAAASQAGRSTLMRPLAILISLLLFLTLPLACSGGGSDNSSSNDDDNSNGNGDDNRNNNDNDNDNDNDNGNLPGAPTGLTATANGSSQIDLSWEAPADDGGSAIGGYKIEYKESSGNWMDAEADTGKTETGYSHISLTAETEYSYRIYAINANGTGPSSNEATATTTSLADDPKPGAPTNLTATAGPGQVILAWEDPEYCGNGNLCSELLHQHYLEYKLTSASDDDWGNGQEVADSSPGPSHTTTYPVMGLTGGMSYDFRLAVQLTGADDRGPWAEISAEPQMDSDGDGVLDGEDAFPADACASVDSDGDGSPDTVLAAGSTAPGGSAACSATSTLAVDAFPADACASADSDGDGLPDTVLAAGSTAPGGSAACSATMLAEDAFPDDACASVDSDGNGRPDAIIAPGDSDDDACTVASTLTSDEDSDGDGVIDSLDVDDDNDGLIEIATRAELNNIRYNLAGGSYDDEEADTGAGDTGNAGGAPQAATTDCSATSGTNAEGEDIFLCGYELANDIDLEGSATGSGNSISCAPNEWTPIAGCGSDGNCGETSGNDDNPFTAILEGNGFTISNVCIEGDGDPSDHDVLGLFGHLGGAAVRNLTIAEVYIESSFTGGDSGNSNDDNRLGALAGYVTGATVILNVTAEDSDSDIDLQGAATVDTQFVGGLVGLQFGGSITASFATGMADGGDGSGDYAGGLVGNQVGGDITASFATGNADGGDGASDRVGGLVGNQVGGDIRASFATGNADGGDRDNDRVGGLLGYQSGGSITASYATGNADGGAGSGDRAGALVGFRNAGSFTNSYGFGTATGEADGTEGSDKPDGVTEAADLTADNAGNGWSNKVWDFGSSSQSPALKYVDGYSGNTYSCDAASFPDSLMVTCGTTLLPGPDDSPQDRE